MTLQSDEQREKLRELERLDSICDSRADQLWMMAEAHLGDIYRIGIEGPDCENDDWLMRRCCALVGQEILGRQFKRMLEDI